MQKKWDLAFVIRCLTAKPLKLNGRHFTLQSPKTKLWAADFLTDTQLAAEIAELAANPALAKNESAERDIYFTDPANAAEIEEQQARMDLVIALYEARRAAGLTQKELAERLGTNQTYVAALEKGRKNITFSTLARYARACGKRVAVTLL